MSGNLRKESKKEWSLGKKPDINELNTGCMLRIADAVDIMAMDYRKLQQERDTYLHWYNKERDRRWALERRISALKGVITKLKRMVRSE